MNLKQKIKYQSENNQCPTCMEMFRSVAAFDRHRTGKFGVDRRCMTVTEMKQCGMMINPQNLWVSSTMDDVALTARRGVKQALLRWVATPIA